mmetsp:Transcript_9433/g.28146  ORF Transcript_9433/g.28146 Transcript_9433/m.28146 type:complete len:432 (-) Transcript_9433:991-2286(-)|eukprot:CAMPEP_0172381802 /NCGR_PEP_ID=MMETSP1060-20121228/71139_1 /TAXON_ID=37318 /ORGANISM="Pseudo-nitzschia pungens, Strain cf. cingulata" /LENGTH=431 /DNA_ID=CAMNT_0013109593 /DNA_START=134 /DNA_END=1429 /DNA_ORIENTATION=+
MSSQGSKKRKFLADCGSVGTPPKTFLDHVETIKFIIYDFEKREEKAGEPIESPVLRAHGREWKVKVFPRGIDLENHEYIACYIYVKNAKDEICIKFRIDFQAIERGYCGPITFTKSTAIRGYNRFETRKKILQQCLQQDGSLEIEVDIKMAIETKKVWYPKIVESQSFLVELYHQASRTGDVSFALEEGKKVFHGHRLVLSRRAKALFTIAEEYGNERPIPIAGVRKEIFRVLLQCIYSIPIPNETMEKDEATLREIFLVANRFQCTQLKLYAESILVDKFLGAENAASLMLFGDSHSCALLKEAAMETFVRNPKTVMRSKDWTLIEESHELLLELMKYYHFGFGDRESASDSECDIPDVATLRKQIQDATDESILDFDLLDGSRELLVERWKKHTCRKRSRTHGSSSHSSSSSDSEFDSEFDSESESEPN